MTVTTIRPDGTTTFTGALTGGATAHAVLSDDSDASYATYDVGDTSVLTLGNYTLAADAVIKSVALRIRTRLGSGAVVNTATQWSQALYGSTVVTWGTPTTTTAFTGTSVLGEALTEAAIDDGTLTIAAPAGNGTVRVYEAYFDVTSVAQPVVGSLLPTGTVTDNQVPPLYIGSTADSDGGAPTHFQIRVFNDAQYGAGGFDHETSEAYDESGETAQAASPFLGTAWLHGWTPNIALVEDTYRTYARVAQTVNGELHWSDWDSEDFVIDVDNPALVSVTATEQSADARNMIEVATDPGGDVSADYVDFEASYDGGETWRPLRTIPGLGRVEVESDEAIAWDWEAPNGSEMTYRARAVHDFGSGAESYSEWMEDTATWASTSIWLKHPTIPTMNYEAGNGEFKSFPGWTREARRGIHQPLGASYPVVVHDTRIAEAGELSIRVDDDDAKVVLRDLADTNVPLLLQFPATDHERDRYVSLGTHTQERVIDQAWMESTYENFEWIEVERITDERLSAMDLIPAVAIFAGGAEVLTGDSMLISGERLASLPTSGDAWEYMLGKADDALANLNLDEGDPDPKSPWLPNYNGEAPVQRPATQTLAMALVYARTGETDYRDKVIEACRFLIGTEDETSTDGTALSDRMLASARQVAAWVLAADLVDMDPTVTGTRTGYTSVQWDEWLLELRDKETSTASSGRAISQCNNEQAHNWAAYCSAARTAIDIYLDDDADLAETVDNLKRYLGDRSIGGSLGSNLIPNPSFETNTTGWSSNAFVALTTFARQSGWADDGSWSCRLTFTDATPSRENGMRTTTGLGGFAVTPDTQYQLRAAYNILAQPTGGFARQRVLWYNAAGTQISTHNGLPSKYTSPDTGVLVDVFTSPPTAAFAGHGIYGNSGTSGGTFDAYIDNVRFRTAATAWRNSSDFDASYVCLGDFDGDAEADWTAVNPSDCGDRKDGLIVEDISRSAVSYEESGTYYARPAPATCTRHISANCSPRSFSTVRAMTFGSGPIRR